MLKTDYGQQEAIAKFGFDPPRLPDDGQEFYKNRPGRSAAR